MSEGAGEDRDEFSKARERSEKQRILKKKMETESSEGVSVETQRCFCNDPTNTTRIRSINQTPFL